MSASTIPNEFFQMHCRPAMKYTGNLLYQRLFTIMGMVFLFLSTFTLSPADARTFRFENAQKTYKLIEYMEFLDDPNGTLTIDEVADESSRLAFKSNTNGNIRFRFSQSVAWARLRIENLTQEELGFVLIIGSYARNVDKIDLYVPDADGGFHCYSDGQSIPQSQAMLPNVYIPSFKFNLREVHDKTIYFRFEDEALAFLYPSIEFFSVVSSKSYWKEGHLWFAVAGAFIFAFLYNLLIYSSLRDSAFLFFSLILIGFPVLFISSCLRLISPENFVPSTWWQNRIQAQCFLFFVITWLLLTNNYFQIGSRISSLNRWIWGLIFTYMLMGAAFFLIPYYWAMAAMEGLNIITALFILAISLNFRKIGFEAGRYYLFAVSITFLPHCINSLYFLGFLDVIPVNILQNRLVHMTYFILVLFFVSLALLDRYNILNKQALTTQQMALLSMLQAEKAKDEFLANTSHELRTPLHGIIGLCEDLLERCKTGIQAGLNRELNIIIHSAWRLSALIDDILDVTRIKQGQLHLSIKPVDFASILTLVTELCRPLINPEKVRLQTEVPDGLPFIMADENRLQQILINLIKNAVKFTPEGVIQIKAKVAEEFLEIAVQDSGIGIAPEKQSAIFERFTQLDGSMERDAGGAGLGLAITKQLVHLHGGGIWVQSSPNKGACFNFTIPLAEENSHESPKVVVLENPNDQRILPPIPFSKSFSNNTNGYENGAYILTVDDEEISRQVLHNHLSTAGYRSVSARNAFEARELLNTQPFDLVVLDIMMPRMNGYTFCRDIRREFNPTELPVIMLTARGGTQDIVKGFDCGANDYLTKPVNRLELLARIQTSLKLKQLVDLLRENKGLKGEILRRKQAENQLQLANRQLAGLLNLWEAALLMVNEHDQILYFNQCAEDLFEYQLHEIVNRPLTLLFPTQIDLIRNINGFSSQLQLQSDMMKSEHRHLTARTANQKPLRLEVIVTPIIVHDQIIYTLICRQLSEKEHEPAPAPYENVQTMERHHQKIQAMRYAFDNALNHLQRTGRKLDAELQQIDRGLADALENLPEKELERQYRQTIVSLMTNALTCWTESTTEDKIALAEQSGIWRASLDVGTYKTRTLDKYLDIDKLPKNPRWKDVMKTADFVLKKSSKTLQSHKALNRSLAHFRAILHAKKIV